MLRVRLRQGDHGWLRRSALALLLTTSPLAAAAQNVPMASGSPLIAEVRLLMRQGTMTPAAGEALIAQLEADAAQRRANAAWIAATGNPPEGTAMAQAQVPGPPPASYAPTAMATAQVPVPAPALFAPPAPPAALPPAAPRVAAVAVPPPAPKSSPPVQRVAVATPAPMTSVAVVPEAIRQQLIAEVKAEVMAQAKAEGWGAPPAPRVATAAGDGLPSPAAGTIRVPFVPETVRRQIIGEVKSEVLAQAKSEGWAAPGDASPDWVRAIKLSGDFRFRSESQLFAKGNSTGVINFAALNGSGPFDVGATSFEVPVLNSTVDRSFVPNIRARLGVEATISPFARVGLRIASGDDSGPISTNVALAGGLGKRDLWLDRAFLTLTPTPGVSATVGRMANPFRSNEILFDTDPDLMFDNDLNFDGAALALDSRPFLDGDAFARVKAGAFPLDFGSPNFPDVSQAKEKFPNKWLFSGQVEAGTTIEDIKVGARAGYHVFKNVQGQLSDPCNIPAGVTVCSTDQTRPFFQRTGNTLFPLRNIISDGAANPANPQFFGLTFGYRIVEAAASVSVPVFDKVQATIDGDYIRNLAFKRGDICRFAPLGSPSNNVDQVTLPNGTVNNDPCSVTNPARFRGGNQGYMVRASIGHARPSLWGEWRVTAGYRYLESDAMLDSLPDSDFHRGGTNSKGYTIGGTLGLFKGVTLSGRWLSANEIIGEPRAIDVLQFDLVAAY